MPGDERGALGRRDLWMFEAILPLVDRPSVEIIFGELREDPVEVDLPIAQRAVPSRALQPWLVPGIEALLAGRAKLGVFHVKALDALMVDVDERDIVQSLLDEVARVIVDVTSRMVADGCQELLEVSPSKTSWQGCSSNPMSTPASSKASRMGVQRRPCSSKAEFDEVARTLRPGIAIGPRERTREGLYDLQPQAA